MVFFAKQKDLVEKMREQREEFKMHNAKFKHEVRARERIEAQQKKQIDHVKEELLLAKRILKDSNLNALANKKFNGSIEKVDSSKFLAEGAILTDLMEDPKEKMEKFECEMMGARNTAKLVRGTEVVPNRDVPASALSIKNEFKKLNLSQFTPNAIKFRTRAAVSTLGKINRRELPIQSDPNTLRMSLATAHKRHSSIEGISNGFKDVYFEGVRMAINNEREAIDMRRQLVQTVQHDAKGPHRRMNISQISYGTGGRIVPPIPGFGKPQTAAYNTARGSSYNATFRGDQVRCNTVMEEPNHPNLQSFSNDLRGLSQDKSRPNKLYQTQRDFEAQDTTILDSLMDSNSNSVFQNPSVVQYIQSKNNN